MPLARMRRWTVILERFIRTAICPIESRGDVSAMRVWAEGYKFNNLGRARRKFYFVTMTKSADASLLNPQNRW
jgi:hypothetical protein